MTYDLLDFDRRAPRSRHPHRAAPNGLGRAGAQRGCRGASTSAPSARRRRDDRRPGRRSGLTTPLPDRQKPRRHALQHTTEDVAMRQGSRGASTTSSSRFTTAAPRFFGPSGKAVSAVTSRAAASSQCRRVGLGLFIARAIAEAHGGTLTLKARRQRGLLSWFGCPRYEVAMSASEAASSASRPEYPASTHCSTAACSKTASTWCRGAPAPARRC